MIFHLVDLLQVFSRINQATTSGGDGRDCLLIIASASDAESMGATDWCPIHDMFWRN